MEADDMKRIAFSLAVLLSCSVLGCLAVEQLNIITLPFGNHLVIGSSIEAVVEQVPGIRPAREPYETPGRSSTSAS
jgi:hypothetical protein